MKKLFIQLSLVGFFSYHAQTYTEPSKMKQCNITVNFDYCTVKTQMLTNTKKLETKSELTYMWYMAQKIMETKGGFDGKLIHGSYRSFYLNDQLKEQGQIKYGLKHKQWKYWYNNGSIRESITWKNGIKTGRYCIYNEEGRLMAQGIFKNDKLNGNFYTFDVSGNVIEKRRYRNGVEIVKQPKIKKEKVKETKPKKIKKEKPKNENVSISEV